MRSGQVVEWSSGQVAAKGASAPHPLDVLGAQIAPMGFVWDATHAELVRSLAVERGATGHAGAWVRDDHRGFSIAWWVEGMAAPREMEVTQEAQHYEHDHLMAVLRESFRRSMDRHLVGKPKVRRFKRRR